MKKYIRRSGLFFLFISKIINKHALPSTAVHMMPSCTVICKSTSVLWSMCDGEAVVVVTVVVDHQTEEELCPSSSSLPVKLENIVVVVVEMLLLKFLLNAAMFSVPGLGIAADNAPKSSSFSATNISSSNVNGVEEEKAGKIAVGALLLCKNDDDDDDKAGDGDVGS